ncbi:MAG TPA: hypothetical protein VEI94_10035 [Candidatus Bathyarchaeia archaeon]|nr:hypothetical protein [Candidatus Bathyarchaeia archaeon]
MNAGRHCSPVGPLRDRVVAPAVLLVALLILLVPGPGRADPVRDTLPFRIAYGRPSYELHGATACFLWVEGGRLHLRITPDRLSHQIEGELRTSQRGAFEDVAPLSERLRPRQPRPTKIMFDTLLDTAEEGFDVTMSGDYAHLTIDLLIDGKREPALLRIGEHQESPAGLPARLRLHGSGVTWRDRLGL